MWDAHLARTGAELLAERLRAGRAAAPLRRQGLRDRGPRRRRATTPSSSTAPSFELAGAEPTAAARSTDALLAELERRRNDELDRGISLVGPHRDELLLTLGTAEPTTPGCRCKGYASHGESWSFALALRLASYDLLRADGDDPILILDDVFAELDTERRAQLADLVAGAEQVLVTAAVAADVPAALAGARFVVADGEVTREPDEEQPTERAGRAADAAPGDAATPDHRDDGLDLARALTRATARSTPAARARQRRTRSAAAVPRPGSPAPTPTTATRSCSTARVGRLVDDHGWELDLRGARRLRPLGRSWSAPRSARTARRSRSPTAGWWSAPTRPPGRPSCSCSPRPSYAGSTRSSATARWP